MSWLTLILGQMSNLMFHLVLIKELYLLISLFLDVETNSLCTRFIVSILTRFCLQCSDANSFIPRGHKLKLVIAAQFQVSFWKNRRNVAVQVQWIPSAWREHSTTKYCLRWLELDQMKRWLGELIWTMDILGKNNIRF